MPLSEREAFSELYRSEEFRNLSPEEQLRVVQRHVRASYGGEEPEKPESGIPSFTDVFPGDIGEKLAEMTQAIPRQWAGIARGAARTVGNLPRGVAEVMQLPGASLPPPFGINPFGENLTPPERIEETFPILAPKEGEEIGNFMGTALPYAAGGVLGGAAKSPVLLPGLMDYLLTLGETDSHGEAAVSAGLGALFNAPRGALRSGSERAFEAARRKVRGLLPTQSARGAAAVEGSIDELLDAGVPKSREAMVEFFADRAAGAEQRLGRATQDLGESVADTSDITEALQPHRARAFTSQTETPEEILARLAAEDPNLGRVLQSIPRDPEDVLDIVRSSGMVPEETLSAQTREVARPAFRREAGALNTMKSELKTLAREVAAEGGEELADDLGEEGVQQLAKSPRLVDLIRKWGRGEGISDPNNFIAAAEADAAEAATEALKSAGSPDDVLEIVHDMRRYHEVADIATRRAFSSGASSGIGQNVGAAATAFGGPVALLRYRTALAILSSPRWPAYGAEGYQLLGRALASPRTDDILLLASRVGAAVPSVADQEGAAR